MYALQLFSEAGPDTSLSWLLWVALGFFFLMVVIGWLSSRFGGGKSADDLTMLEGIGPKVAKILSEAGLTTYNDLARARAVEVDKVLDAAGLQMMDSEGWIEQAKLAAKGDFPALTKLQEELKGGRRPS